MTYLQFEKHVYDALKQYRQEHPTFSYALRMDRKGEADLDLFLSQRQYNEFTTKFYRAKAATGSIVSFAGAHFIYKPEGITYDVHLSQSYPKDKEDAAAVALWQLGNRLKGRSSELWPRSYLRNPNNQHVNIHLLAPKEHYEDIDELMADFFQDATAMTAVIDEEAERMKSEYPALDLKKYQPAYYEKWHKRIKWRYEQYSRNWPVYEATGRNYWIVSTTYGDLGDVSAVMLKENIVAVGYGKQLDLTPVVNKANKDIIQFLRVNGQESDKKVLTNFLNIRPGDRVALKQGAQKILAYGTVQNGPYIYRPDGIGHTFPVVWEPNRSGIEIPTVHRGTIFRVDSVEKAYAVFPEEGLVAIIPNDQQLSISDSSFPMPNQPKNQLLYGPPGTGKTHATLTKAVNLAQPGHQAKTRADYRKLYQQLTAEGKITFITFHQSLSYEDFVEGLKPLLNDELADGEVRYQIQPGILREVVSEAVYSYVARGRSQQQTTTPEFIAVWNAYLAEVRNQLEFRQPVTLKMKNGNEAEIVDISSQNNLRVKHVNGDHIYSVSSARQAKLNEAFPKLEDLEGNLYTAFNEVIGGSNASLQWAVLNAIQEFAATMTASQREESQRTLSRSDRRELARNLKRIDFSPTDVDRHVLIIDEINRGNVSAILGELITLLEPDKRLGGPEALTVTLPYSRDEFGIPPNLYLIGTMNTADRSVESLDAALRRRFVFEEIGPDPQVITNVAPNGGVVDVNGRPVDLAVLLNLLNNRIATLRDEDHQLGHSYFLHISDWQGLRTVFRDRILPLLREYFFANYGQLQLIVGNGFCVSSQTGGTTFAQADADEGLDTDGLRRFTFPEASSAAELAEQLTKLKYPWPT